MAGRADRDADDDAMMMGEDKASCSCIEGNPCMSAYNSKVSHRTAATLNGTPPRFTSLHTRSHSGLRWQDWHNRFDVAKRNGWKGFS